MVRAALLTLLASPVVGSFPAWMTRNLNTIEQIYNLTIYPHNAPIIEKGHSAVPPGLFADNARGRVTPLGNFTGFDDSIEYFFGLAPTPQTNPGSLGIYEADVVEFTSGCPQVAASTVYLKTAKVDAQTGAKDPASPTTVLKQVAFWRFNEAGLVTDYDAWIPTLQKWTDVATGINYTDPVIDRAAIDFALCPQIQQRCTGAHAQFASLQQCKAALAAKPFGTFDNAWTDSIACRLIHILLTKVRPDVHCPHVGPTGGGKCVNVDYRHDYTNDAELFEGEQFMCRTAMPHDWPGPVVSGPARSGVMSTGGGPGRGPAPEATPAQGPSTVPRARDAARETRWTGGKKRRLFALY